MSELITTFSFDLQRFASKSGLQVGWGDLSVKSALNEVAAASLATAENNNESINTHFYWATAADSIIVAGADSVLADVNNYTATSAKYSVSSDPSIKSGSYYTVALSDFTKLYNLAGATGISLGVGTNSLSFAVPGGNGSLGSADQITLSGGNFSALKLASEGSGVSVASGSTYDSEGLTINGNLAQVDGGFGYLYAKKNDEILFIDPTSSTVNSAGAANRVSLTTAATYGTPVEILGNEYTVGGTGYFNLNKGKAVTGFTFDSVNASIGGDIGDTSLALHYAGKSSLIADDGDIKAPTLSGDGSYLYMGIGGANGASVSVGASDGAVIKFASYSDLKKSSAVTATVNGVSADSLNSNFFEFNQDGTLTNVVLDSVTSGYNIEFDGLKASGNKTNQGAISVGGALLGIGSGKFAYGQAEESSVTGITLKSATDTVWAAGAASLVTSENEKGTIYFFGDKDKNKYEFVNTSGEAQFSLAGADSLAGFTFGGEGDALTRLGTDSIGLSYLDGEGVAQSLPGVGVTLKSNKNAYTTTYLDEEAVEFGVSGLDAGAKASVGTGETFTFNGVAGGSLTFDSVGATSVSLGSGGQIAFDSVAAGLFAQTSEDRDPFEINGKAVNLAVTANKEIVYDVDEKSLTLDTVQTDAKITDAGAIEKIYLAGGTDSQNFTFKAGEENADDQQAFTVVAGGTNDSNKAFFNVSGASATGFVFGKVNDAITGNFEGLKLYDGASDTEGFGAPVITEIEDGEAVTDATITKIQVGKSSNKRDAFQVTIDTGKNVKLDSGTELAFTTVGNTDRASVQFAKTGELVAVNGLTEKDDELTVTNAEGAVSLGSDVVEITGGEFTYKKVEDEESGDPVSALVGLKSGVEVKQSTGIAQLRTAGGTDGNGTFKFGGASFAISGADNDTVEGEEGVTFQWDDENKKATGIDSLDENTSIASANFNGMKIKGADEAIEISDGTYTLFGGGLSLAGLKNGAEVTKAGGVSNFLTDGSGKFTILSTGMSITDSDGVTFVTDGAKLTGIDKLNGMAVGNFEEGLAVNSLSSVKVSGDSSVAVVGDDKTVLAIEELGVADATKEIKVMAAGVSTFGVDQNGLFDFNGSASFGVAGNGKEVTLFDLAKSAIVGVDATETLSGDFSAGYTVDGNEIQVTGDTDISIVGGTQILGLTAGASVAKAAGISVAKTDEEAFTGVFNFGGQSFKVTSVDGVEFQLKDGKVVGISGIGDGENVTGDLNGITMNGKAPEIIVTHKDGTPNTDLYFENGTLSGIVDGDTVVKADNVSTIIASASGVFKFAGGQSFKTSDTDGITFEVKPGSEVEVLAITDLAAGASLEGTLGGLSINTKTVDIKNDDDFGVIGAEGDIGGVYNLSNGAIVNDAAGATVAITDTEGVFTFKGGQSFVTAGDSSVSFTLDKSAVTAVAGLSAGSVFGDFSAIDSVNEQTFAVSNDPSIEVFAAADGKLSKIAQVSGGASIGQVGSISQIVTDKAGLFTFTVGSQSFMTGNGADTVTFGLSSSKVVSISDLKGSVEGKFDGIAINGATLDIVDGDGKLTVLGDGTKLTAIQGVDADATIKAAGGVTELVGNIGASVGSFTFGGNSGAFTVADDKQITFKLDGASVATVTGIADLAGSVMGNFAGISSINGQSFAITNDPNNILSVYGDGKAITKIGGVGGGASIGFVGSASQIITDSVGKFSFLNGAWSIATDTEVTFGIKDSKVVSITGLSGVVEGGFSNVTVNGKSVEITGDTSVALVGGASGITAIQNLSASAVVGAVGGASVAITDTAGKFTFSNGSFSIAGDADGVTFLLDGDKVVGLKGLDVGATLTGDLGELSAINGASLAITGDKDGFGVVGAASGISQVIKLSTPADVKNAGGASVAVVDTAEVFTFPNGEFKVAGDSAAIFQLDPKTSEVIGVTLKEGASISGALNGLVINGGESIVVENDKDFGAVAGSKGATKLFDISDGASVVAAGGASQFVTDTVGDFNILGTAMGIAEDTSVVFTAGASGITAIDELVGTATGDFTKEIAINKNAVQILGDSSIAVTATEKGISSIGAVGGIVTVVKDGGASAVGTDEVGTFTFQASGQSFVVEGDQAITFALADSSVTGVSNFDQVGTLGFNKEIEALAVNDAALTFKTTTNASLSIANGAVNYVKGVTDEVDGLENATVAATKSMTVNGKAIAVEGDEDYKVVVANGEVVGLQGIGNADGVTVGVEGVVSILADASGKFDLNGEQYSFTDEDNNFGLNVDADNSLAAVTSLEGSMIIAEPNDLAASFAINNGELAITSNDSVTVAAGLSGITAVDGLDSGDVIIGALNNASIAMVGTSSTVVAEGTQLNVNGVGYTLLNDADGVTVNGAQQIVGLDEGASLIVDTAGTYTVNGSSETADKDAVWVGDESGSSAYIYDPSQMIITRSTPVEDIEIRLGLPEYPADATFGGKDLNHETPETDDDPLTTAGLSALFENEDLNRPVAVYATNDDKEEQVIDFSDDDDFSKKVTMYEGDQKAKFGDSGQNLAVVDKQASGNKDIDMGNGGDAAIVQADKGSVDITGGAGDDTVVVQGSAPVNFDMSAGGADRVITFAKALAKIFLTGYDALANPNAGVTISEKWASLVDAISTGKISFSDNKLIIGENAAIQSTVDFGDSFNHFVNLFNYLGQKLVAGFTNSDGGLVDGSTSQDPLLLIGNNNGDKTGNSTMLGGNSDDTALAGAGDVIDLGAGNNQIDLQDDPNRGGADIVLRLGRTIINGFNGTFNSDHGDNINADITDAKISFVDGNVIIEGVDFYAILANVKTDGELSYDTASDLVESADATSTNLLTQSGDYTNVLFNDTTRAAIARKGGVIDVKVDSTERANTYIGDESGLTFYDKDGEVMVNLEYGAGSIDTETVTYEGINSVQAGNGQTTLIGGDNNETFFAGTGNDSMYGAGGKNLMVGYDDAGEKTGQTSFFVAAAHDGAANTIQSFNFVNDDNYTNTNKITADRLDIDVEYHEIRTEEGAVEVSGDDVVITVSNRNNSNVETVVIEGARGKDFAVSGEDGDIVAQVNTNSLVADKFANYFVATEKNASLTVSDDKDNFYIYLGGKPLGTDYEGEVPVFYGDINVIDARGSNAVAELGGNNNDNTIYAGTGDASLWGGDGGNDLLVGGAGKNTFYYNYGNGNDTVEGAEEGDVIDLTNITLAEISEANISESGVELKFTDGGSLTVNSTAGEYKVGESTYVVEDGAWKTKE